MSSRRNSARPSHRLTAGGLPRLFLEDRIAPAIGFEYEPNDTLTTANFDYDYKNDKLIPFAVPSGDITQDRVEWLEIRGAILNGDTDHFRISIPFVDLNGDSKPDPLMTFIDLDSRNFSSLSKLDSFVEVYSTGGALIARGDDGYDLTNFAPPIAAHQSPNDTRFGRSLDTTMIFDKTLAGGQEYIVRVGAIAGTGLYNLKILSDPNYTVTPPSFNSLPADKQNAKSGTLYLDFNGHAAEDDFGAYALAPYTFDNNAFIYSPIERLGIKNIWLTVADDFAPFNLNVTTDAKTHDKTNYDSPEVEGKAYQIVFTTTFAKLFAFQDGTGPFLLNPDLDPDDVLDQFENSFGLTFGPVEQLETEGDGKFGDFYAGFNDTLTKYPETDPPAPPGIELRTNTSFVFVRDYNLFAYNYHYRFRSVPFGAPFNPEPVPYTNITGFTEAAFYKGRFDELATASAVMHGSLASRQFGHALGLLNYKGLDTQANTVDEGLMITPMPGLNPDPGEFNDPSLTRRGPIVRLQFLTANVSAGGKTVVQNDLKLIASTEYKIDLKSSTFTYDNVFGLRDDDFPAPTKLTAADPSRVGIIEKAGDTDTFEVDGGSFPSFVFGRVNRLSANLFLDPFDADFLPGNIYDVLGFSPLPVGGTEFVGKYEVFAISRPDVTFPFADKAAEINYIIDEGQGVQITPTINDKWSKTLTPIFEWDLDGDGIFGEVGKAATRGKENLQSPFLDIADVDGPGKFSVTVRILDVNRFFILDEQKVTIRINNVAPTATLVGPDRPVAPGEPAAFVQFINIFDPSPTDVKAGLRFAYDFDNDGVFEIGGDGSYEQAVNPSKVLVPPQFLLTTGTRTVRGRIIDKDGGFTESTTTITIGGAPFVGSETLVNTTIFKSQLNPAIAVDPAGDFVVAWQGYGDGSGYGVYFQRYSKTGVPAGTETLVNQTTTFFQTNPSVAVDADGDFVVAWQSSNQDGNGYSVYFRRYNSAGAPLGGEVLVNQTSTLTRVTPSVAVDADGDFVVAWAALSSTTGFNIFARVYGNDGLARTGEFLVNTFLAGNQIAPAVAADADGNFVVAWQSEGQDGSGFGIYARRFANTGTPLAGEFRVNDHTTGDQIEPAIAADKAGNFVITWTSNGQDGSQHGVYARRYGSAGTTLLSPFRVNAYTTDSQRSPAVAADAAGNFVISWQSLNQAQSQSDFDVYFQRYQADGTPLALGDFRVNSFTTGAQRNPTVGMSAAGNFVIAWQSNGQDGFDEGIFLQRFANPFVPRILSLTIDDGESNQRSLVRSARVEFSTAVTFSGAAASAFVLQRAGSAGTVPLTVDLSQSTPLQTIAVITFGGAFIEAGSKSLIDGNYSLQILASKISASGVALDGDGDGAPGGNGTAQFHRLFGDVDGNRTVNFVDFLAFRATFGLSLGQPGFNPYFDNDNTSTVDFTDFLAFRLRFGTVLP